MIKIGAGWNRVSKETNKEYISCSISKELLPLNIKENQFLTLHQNENKTEDKHPDYNVCLSDKEDNK